jgi:hypothetical protein
MNRFRCTGDAEGEEYYLEYLRQVYLHRMAKRECKDRLKMDDGYWRSLLAQAENMVDDRDTADSL